MPRRVAGRFGYLVEVLAQAVLYGNADIANLPRKPFDQWAVPLGEMRISRSHLAGPAVSYLDSEAVERAGRDSDPLEPHDLHPALLPCLRIVLVLANKGPTVSDMKWKFDEYPGLVFRLLADIVHGPVEVLGPPV